MDFPPSGPRVCVSSPPITGPSISVITSYSIHYTKLYERGVRIATLPGVTSEIMVRCMNADYNLIAARTKKLCSMLEKTAVVRVTSPAGTDITLPMKGRKAHASTGLFREAGQWGNLPTGEAYLAPLEGKSNGIMVVDGSMAGVGMVSTPIRIEVRDGYASDISGGEEATKLNTLLRPHGRDGRNVAEFGIGTNDRASYNFV